MAKYIFNSVLADTLDNLPKLNNDILSFVNECCVGVSDETRNDLRLVFNELLINAVIHGKSLDNGRCVSVRIVISDNILSAEIADASECFALCSIINSAKHNNRCLEKGLMDETGRGLLIVTNLTDSISCNLKGDTIMFTKKLVIHG
jgi:serine/threonine-protein kinase RsbW